MNPKKRAVTAAVAGTAIGAAGLGILAMPAGAGEAPDLPPISPEALVESVLEAEAPALAGTVAVDNALGLPSVPGMPALDTQSGRVYYDGEGDSRLAAQRESSELTVVKDGTTVWTYDSAEHTASRIRIPDEAATRHEGRGMPEGMTDPASAASRLVAHVRESSTVAVDGTASVAGRTAYELVLTPKPDERTLLREVRVAVDSETRLPLRMSVLTNGTTEPALEIGFTEIEFGPQPAELFTFTPPPGTEVTEQQPQRGPRMSEQPPVRAVGDGWDTVAIARVPAEALRGLGQDGDVRGLLEQLGRPVSGEFGSGHLVETRVGSALVTDDGRVAVGAVPEQVLTQALENR